MLAHHSRQSNSTMQQGMAYDERDDNRRHKFRFVHTHTFSTAIANPFIFWHSTPNQYVRFRTIDCITRQQCFGFGFGFYFWSLYRWRLAQWCCWSVNSSHAIICIYGICSRRNTINCRAMGYMSAIHLIRLICEKLREKSHAQHCPVNTQAHVMPYFRSTFLSFSVNRTAAREPLFLRSSSR